MTPRLILYNPRVACIIMSSSGIEYMIVAVWIALTCDGKIAYAVGKHPQKSLYLKKIQKRKMHLAKDTGFSAFHYSSLNINLYIFKENKSFIKIY